MIFINELAYFLKLLTGQKILKKSGSLNRFFIVRVKSNSHLWNDDRYPVGKQIGGHTRKESKL